ncbi:hypothetical protein ROJ8625_01036 [Roseivivax jejudonensis]|uniref:Uncharacterized protein n=1 Tax=Roseivivax jejudonensis TaxID=1529041 RepID=A0A1X6YMZ5_9RHOB|nr:hypothetical protein ROJ8625_01036 [Roseivivax jejudonensis]
MNHYNLAAFAGIFSVLAVLALATSNLVNCRG